MKSLKGQKLSLPLGNCKLRAIVVDPQFYDIEEGKMSDKLEFSNNLFTIKDLYLPGLVSIRTHLFDKKFQNY